MATTHPCSSNWANAIFTILVLPYPVAQKIGSRPIPTKVWFLINSDVVLAGTQGNALASHQAELVLANLPHLVPELNFQVNIVRTKEDINSAATLIEMGLGVFE